MARALESGLLPEETPGVRIRNYKLLQKIGEGGFGVVWMAEQEEPVRRRVALKVLKPGMDTKEVIARFEAERQALALMDHPNIAHVFDAGATDAGRPYFVMELVRGVPITRYCDENRMPAEARLGLFVSICQAVQHAHQKGVVHRDLKPSNILVTLHDGVPVPKIIDFGIAKAMQGRLTDKTLFTQFHAFVGTPVYTSPEQMEMSGLDVDTRSDIYSLGVLLYELLAGRPPFDPDALAKSGLEAMRRTIREVDPPRPSHRLDTLSEADRTSVAHQRDTNPVKLSLLLRGDLDWIVMRCLEKDRTRRYDTAAALAADIQHHLRSEPVAARPPSQFYRTGKFVRRHRVGVAAVAAVALSLVGGLITASTLLVRERAARQRAVAAEESEGILRRRAETARQLETKRAAHTALMLAEQLLAQGRTAEGLAYLVHAARKDPQNPTIAPRLASILTARNFLLPDGAPLQLGSRVLRSRFFPDGQRIRILCEDGTLAVVDLASGEVLRNKSPSPPTRSLWGAATKKEGAMLCRDGVVRVFDWDTMQLVREIRFEKKGQRAIVRDECGLMLVQLEDQSLVLADIATGRTQPLPWLTRTAEYEFTRDGRWWAVISESHRELYLFDGLTGEKRKTLSFAGRLLGAWISPDETRLATHVAIDDRRALQIWSFPNLEPLTDAQLVENAAQEGQPTSMIFSRDGRWLLVATPNGKQVYALATGAKVGAYVASPIGSELFSPDGRRFTSAVAGGIQLWDTATGTPATPPMLHDATIRSTSFSDNGDVLLTTCSDGFVRLWNTATGQLLAEPTLQQSIDVVAALSPDGTRLVIGTVGGTVYRLRVGRGAARPVSLPRTADAMPAPFMADAPASLLWLQRDRAKVIDAASGREVKGGFTYPEPIDSLGDGGLSIGVRSDLRVMVVTTASGKWQAWELGGAGITRIVSLEGAPGAGGWIRFSPSGDLVAIIANNDRPKVRFWDLRTGKRVGPPCVYNAPIGTNANPGAFSPDGRRFVAGDILGVVKVWEVATGRALLQLGPLRDTWVRCVDYNPDGTRIVTANDWGETQLWDAATGRPASAILYQSGEIESAVFSRDGKYLLTASQDRTARVWDGHDGTPVGEPMFHGGALRSAQFSADGSRVVTASQDATARVWDVQTGQPLTEPMMHPGRVVLAVFSPDGRFVRTETAGSPAVSSTFFLWSVPPEAGDVPAPEWLLQLATICAAKTINEAGQCVNIPEVIAQTNDVRRELAALPDHAPFVEWGRWILNDRADRSIAPGFTLTPAEADKLAADLAASGTPNR